MIGQTSIGANASSTTLDTGNSNSTNTTTAGNSETTSAPKANATASTTAAKSAGVTIGMLRETIIIQCLVAFTMTLYWIM